MADLRMQPDKANMPFDGLTMIGRICNFSLDA